MHFAVFFGETPEKKVLACGGKEGHVGSHTATWKMIHYITALVSIGLANLFDRNI